ncbi:N-acetylneuraminate synthase family protein [Oleidesulfovibrio sp.]|uniref:N-acetylneuraminate synthase family protein n=1 Tax=Oleidesulfovibrio sp. TaxID=2909707 RepID=UPI003A8B7AF4
MGVQFIAEISSNHNVDLARCLRFVDVAGDIGCDGVKFQLFRIKNLFAPEILKKSAMHRAREKWELPVSFLPSIAEHCRKKGLSFSCTPFDLQAVEEMAPYVDFYKIASYELTWPALLEACAAKGKPVVLSTGMADIDEVRQATHSLRNAGCEDLTLLHCVSNYPSAPEQSNLACIRTLRETCQCKTGWSDHSVSSAVIYRAVHAYSASMIEFHLDIEGEGYEYQGGHCWLPDQIKKVIDDVRVGESADGNGEKTYTAGEQNERMWRADPEDGLRPFKEIREHFSG